MRKMKDGSQHSHFHSLLPEGGGKSCRMGFIFLWVCFFIILCAANTTVLHRHQTYTYGIRMYSKCSCDDVNEIAIIFPYPFIINIFPPFSCLLFMQYFQHFCFFFFLFGLAFEGMMSCGNKYVPLNSAVV